MRDFYTKCNVMYAYTLTFIVFFNVINVSSNDRL